MSTKARSPSYQMPPSLSPFPPSPQPPGLPALWEPHHILVQGFGGPWSSGVRLLCVIVVSPFPEKGFWVVPSQTSPGNGPCEGQSQLPSLLQPLGQLSNILI